MLVKPEFPNEYAINSGTYFVKGADFKMVLNEYGEYSPVIVGGSADVNFLDAMANEEYDESVISAELYSKIPDIKHHSVIGYYKDLYAGFVAEGDYRKNASSGGMGTWIFKELFERGLIDGVIHVKPANDGDGILFKYAISRNVEEIQAGAKTKYYPAELSGVLSIVRQVPGRYAVIGIPSFIMELRLLAKYDPLINERIAYTIGLICGHQKTAKYAESLAWECGIKPGDLIMIDFRKKVEGSPASLYSMEITGKVNGEIITVTRQHDLFFSSNWGHGFFKSQFSDFTDDSLNETADIALGDAWLPEYIKDSKGNNIVIVRNEMIHQIIEQGIVSGKLSLNRVSEQDILRSQSGLIHHTRDELPYRLFKKDKNNEWRPKKRITASSSNVPFLKQRVQDLRAVMLHKCHVEYRKAVQQGDWNAFTRAMKPYIFAYKVLYKLIQVEKNGVLWLLKGFVGKLKRKLKLV